MLPKLERELIQKFEKYNDAISSTEKRKGNKRLEGIAWDTKKGKIHHDCNVQE